MSKQVRGGKNMISIKEENLNKEFWNDKCTHFIKKFFLDAKSLIKIAKYILESLYNVMSIYFPNLFSKCF